MMLEETFVLHPETLRMVEWIDDRIEQMLERPSMFGPLDSVELDVITLLDARDFALHKISGDVYKNFTDYINFGKLVFPDGNHSKQFSEAFSDFPHEFSRCMREFVELQKMK